MCRTIGFRSIGPFELRGKEPPVHAYVSSSPSEIPYDGFSPVRLQTGVPPLRSSAPSSRLKRQIRIRSRFDSVIRTRASSTIPPCGPCRHVVGGHSQDVPVQRPLAPQPVVVSGQIIAYYGLICASRSLSPLSVYMQRAFARRSALGWSREGPQFTLRVCSLRAIFRTPMDRAAASDCYLHRSHWPSPSLHRVGIHIATIDGSQVDSVTRLQSSLHVTARKDCWPFTVKDVYVRAFTSQVTSKRCRI